MAGGTTVFPASLDANAVRTNVHEITSTDQNDRAVQIEAIEAKVGIDGSAVVGSLDYKVATGWTSVSGTWTYASATTITVPSDATTLYNVGDKIRLKQGGGFKYYSVVAVAATVLTVTGGTDYTVANAAITNIAYSKHASPTGFPPAFNYTATVSQGASTNIAATVTYSKFAIQGGWMTWQFRYDMTGTGTAGSNVILTTPVTMANVGTILLGIGSYYDSGTASYSCIIGGGPSTVSLSADSVIATSAAIGSNPNIAVASGDIIGGTVIMKIV